MLRQVSKHRWQIVVVKSASCVVHFPGGTGVGTFDVGFPYAADQAASQGNIGKMRDEVRSGLIHEARLIAVAVVPVVAASVIGQIAAYPNLTPWYADLIKPAFNPPNWIFAPAWTTLYLLMAFAVWRVLRLRRKTPARRLGLFLFFFQLALNGLALDVFRRS